MDDRCRVLRKAIEQSRSGQSCWQCPQGLRSEVVAFARERQAGGEGVGRIARALGVSSTGLARWLGSTDGGFRPVRVRQRSSPTEDLVLVTPRGFRLEGLTEALALRLLREL